MNSYFQEKKTTFLILAGVLFALLLVLYFILLRPYHVELKSKEAAIVTTTNEIKILEHKIEGDSEDDAPIEIDIEMILQEKQIPRTREVEELLLDVQEVELISLSHIEDIKFQYDTSLSLEAPIEEDEDEEETEADKNKAEADDAVGIDRSEIELSDENTLIDYSTMPEGLEAMTIQLDVLSPNYKYFKEFITGIEEQDRLMIISKLAFKKPNEKEIYFEEDIDNKVIIYNMEITTFYYPE